MRTFALGLLATVALTAAGLVVLQRFRTGAWSPPDLDHIVVPLREALAHDPGPRVPRTIVLWRGGATVTPGDDASHALRSSVVSASGKAKVTIPKYAGGDKRWRELVRCVKDQFAPFDVAVVEEKPADAGYVLALFGGTAALVGREKNVGGLAPYSGAVVEDPVVFVFTKTLGDDVRASCETAAMEIAHAYGLDHEYLCSDVMSYLKPCGRRTFQAKEVSCGEKRPRPCGDGKPTQSSRGRLLSVLGPARTAGAGATAR